jgi:hypothetical protein
MATKYEELVRAESEDETEPESEDETEPESEEEGEPESEEEGQEDEQPPLAQIGEAEIRKAEKAREAQRRKLAAILGEQYVAHECIFCSGLGFTPEPPPVGTVLTVVAGEDGLAFEAEAPVTEAPLLQAPDKQMCPECDGWGEVFTGAKAPQKIIGPCSKCSGNGWVVVARAELLPEPMPPGVPGGAPPSLEGVPDAWGRPFGHQHWGVPPAQIPG